MTPCEAFTRAILAKLFEECGDLEYSDAMDIGVETGVLVTEPFDEERHQDIPGADEMMKGDVVYVLAPELREGEGT
jgi:hypothetical protein